MAATERTTGTVDVVNDLIMSLHDTLHDAEQCARYVDDAQRVGDQELAQLFQEMQEENQRRAERLKYLLAMRLPGRPIPPERPPQERPKEP